MSPRNPLYRSRKRDGLAVLQVEVSLVDLSEALVEAGELPYDQCENREAIRQAVERLLAKLASE